jgi:hypothetical protein
MSKKKRYMQENLTPPSVHQTDKDHEEHKHTQTVKLQRGIRMSRCSNAIQNPLRRGEKSLPNELEYIVAALLFSGAREGHPLKSCTREKHRPDLWYIHFSKTG